MKRAYGRQLASHSFQTNRAPRLLNRGRLTSRFNDHACTSDKRNSIMSSEIAEKAAELFHQIPTQQAAAAALNHERIAAILGAWLPRKQFVERPGGKLPVPCQALVNALFEEASAFHGAVPTE